MRFGHISLLFVALLLAQREVSASSVKAVDLAGMLEASELVFEGVVERHDLEVDAATGIPWTVVRFRVLDVVKGDARGEALSLRFPGGAVGERKLEVSDLVIPAVGERGIYFVESTEERLVNPLYGWSQGHFRVESDPAPAGARASSRPEVRTSRGRPVVALESHAGDPAPGLSNGVAAGVVEGPSPSAANALAPDAFKARLREIAAGLP